MNTVLIQVRPGLVLHEDELLDHLDDAAVARIVEERWPKLFEDDVRMPTVRASTADHPPRWRLLNPPWGEP